MHPLLHLNWNITYRCPLSCAHCYSRALADTPELDLPGKLAVCENIIKSGVFSVNLGGGEPIFHPDTEHVVRRLSSSNVHVTLCTSGFMVGKNEVRAMAEAGLRTSYVSIDDDRPAHHDAVRGASGVLESALAAVRLFKDRDIEVGISCAITSDNISRLSDIAALAESIGASSVEFKRLKPQGNATALRDLLLSPEEEVLLYDLIPRIKAERGIGVSLIYGARKVDGVDEGCPCGKTIMSIMSDGTIAPCVYNPIRIGDATRDDLLAVWATAPQIEHLRNSGTCAGLEAAHPSGGGSDEQL